MTNENEVEPTTTAPPDPIGNLARGYLAERTSLSLKINSGNSLFAEEFNSPVNVFEFQDFAKADKQLREEYVLRVAEVAGLASDLPAAKKLLFETIDKLDREPSSRYAKSSVEWFEATAAHQEVLEALREPAADVFNALRHYGFGLYAKAKQMERKLDQASEDDKCEADRSEVTIEPVMDTCRKAFQKYCRQAEHRFSAKHKIDSLTYFMLIKQWQDTVQERTGTRPPWPTRWPGDSSDSLD